MPTVTTPIYAVLLQDVFDGNNQKLIKATFDYVVYNRTLFAAKRTMQRQGVSRVIGVTVYRQTVKPPLRKGSHQKSPLCMETSEEELCWFLEEIELRPDHHFTSSLGTHATEKGEEQLDVADNDPFTSGIMFSDDA